MPLEEILAGAKMVEVRTAHPHLHLISSSEQASCFPLTKGRFATLISAYAPTLDAEHNIKEDFYQALDSVIQTTQATDKIILMGDFNARVGTEHLVWSKVIGQHGVGKMNSNGLRLLSLCAEHDVVITNTTFQMKNLLLS